MYPGSRPGSLAPPGQDRSLAPKPAAARPPPGRVAVCTWWPLLAAV